MIFEYYPLPIPWKSDKRGVETPAIRKHMLRRCKTIVPIASMSSLALKRANRIWGKKVKRAVPNVMMSKATVMPTRMNCLHNPLWSASAIVIMD